MSDSRFSSSNSPREGASVDSTNSSDSISELRDDLKYRAEEIESGGVRTRLGIEFEAIFSLSERVKSIFDSNTTVSQRNEFREKITDLYNALFKKYGEELNKKNENITEYISSHLQQIKQIDTALAALMSSTTDEDQKQELRELKNKLDAATMAVLEKYAVDIFRSIGSKDDRNAKFHEVYDVLEKIRKTDGPLKSLENNAAYRGRVENVKSSLQKAYDELMLNLPEVIKKSTIEAGETLSNQSNIAAKKLKSKSEGIEMAFQRYEKVMADLNNHERKLDRLISIERLSDSEKQALIKLRDEVQRHKKLMNQPFSDYLNNKLNKLEKSMLAKDRLNKKEIDNFGNKLSQLMALRKIIEEKNLGDTDITGKMAAVEDRLNRLRQQLLDRSMQSLSEAQAKAEVALGEDRQKSILKQKAMVHYESDTKAIVSEAGSLIEATGAVIRNLFSPDAVDTNDKTKLETARETQEIHQDKFNKAMAELIDRIMPESAKKDFLRKATGVYKYKEGPNSFYDILNNEPINRFLYQSMMIKMPDYVTQRDLLTLVATNDIARSNIFKIMKEVNKDEKTLKYPRVWHRLLYGQSLGKMDENLVLTFRELKTMLDELSHDDVAKLITDKFNHDGDKLIQKLRNIGLTDEQIELLKNTNESKKDDKLEMIERLVDIVKGMNTALDKFEAIPADERVSQLGLPKAVAAHENLESYFKTVDIFFTQGVVEKPSPDTARSLFLASKKMSERLNKLKDSLDQSGLADDEINKLKGQLDVAIQQLQLVIEKCDQVTKEAPAVSPTPVTSPATPAGFRRVGALLKTTSFRGPPLASSGSQASSTQSSPLSSTSSSPDVQRRRAMAQSDMKSASSTASSGVATPTTSALSSSAESSLPSSPSFLRAQPSSASLINCTLRAAASRDTVSPAQEAAPSLLEATPSANAAHLPAEVERNISIVTSRLKDVENALNSAKRRIGSQRNNPDYIQKTEQVVREVKEILSSNEHSKLSEAREKLTVVFDEMLRQTLASRTAPSGKETNAPSSLDTTPPSRCRPG